MLGKKKEEYDRIFIVYYAHVDQDKSVHPLDQNRPVLPNMLRQYSCKSRAPN